MSAYLHASHRLADVEKDLEFDFEDLIYMTGAKYRAHIYFDDEFGGREIASRPIDAPMAIPAGALRSGSIGITAWRGQQ